MSGADTASVSEQPLSEPDRSELHYPPPDTDLTSSFPDLGPRVPPVPEYAAGGVDESEQWDEDDSHDSELKRMKVYELTGSRWVDLGTGFCSGDFKDNEALLIARDEEDLRRVILTTAIQATVVYQRQRERLIVWKEPNGVDYALSFEDRAGCAEVWHFIEEIQRIMNADSESNMNVSGLKDKALRSSPVIGPDGP